MSLNCVMGCSSNNSNTIFNFPINQSKRQAWLKGLNLDIYYRFNGPTGVCERHFSPTVCRQMGSMKLLSINAVPDLILRADAEPEADDMKHFTQNGLIAVKTVSNINSAQLIPPQQIVPSLIQLPLPNLPTENIVLQHIPLQQIPLQQLPIQQITPLQLISSPQEKLQPLSDNDDVLVKMEIDADNPQLSSGDIAIPMAMPMVEPDSIKIEVEDFECDVPDPLDPFMDRIQHIQNRNKANAKLQAKMKECKAKIREERKKLIDLKRNLKLSLKRFNILDTTDKKYNDDVKKICKLRKIYFEPELNIPKLMYDRYGIGDFDGLKYPNELKQFAIELYTKSPVAYDYVRESLCKVIPHPDAIIRWTKPPAIVENEE